ncbi:MAG: hypothetical protein ACD_5C00289G0004 [uncultured bacterium]|nr:MAG: hypothetical protein ACD_5C00289G0004 [uncultured bacterium]
MASLYTEADKNTRLTWIYITGFLIFVIGVGYFFAQIMGSRGILYGAVLFSTLMSVGSYWWSDKIVLSMSGAKEVTHDNARELYHLVENLCITAGLPTPKIYIIEDSAPNAFATGRNPEHGVICVTTGILQKLEKNELEGVLAHELSHIGNRDILLSTVVVVLVGFIALIADWFQHWAFFGGGDDDNENSNPLFMIAGILLSLLAPLAATLIQLAISRKREYLADASAALLTRYPEGLARALEKISSDKEPLEAANRATAHLYIANPFKGGNIAKLFSTHPPIEERVARLRGTDTQ